MPFTSRINSTESANKIIDQLRAEHNCELVFHQGGGCCDGSAPMCFEVGDFILGSMDVKIGEIHGCEFYMPPEHFEYMRGTHLTIDIVEGRGSSFSLEIPLGIRFMAIFRLYTDEEFANLEEIS